MKFTHTNIISSNWRALADFYIKTLDCTLVPPVRKQSGTWLDQGTGVKNAQLEGAHLLLPGHGKDGPTLEIYQYKETEIRTMSHPNTKGFGHIAFEVDNVESILKKLKLHGGSTNGSITKREIDGVGIITFVYARDPEGNLIELQHWKK